MPSWTEHATSTERACYTPFMKRHAHSRQRSRLLWPTRCHLLGLLALLGLSCAEPRYVDERDQKVPAPANQDAGRPAADSASVGPRDAQSEVLGDARTEPSPDAASIFSLSDAGTPGDATPIQGSDGGTEWWARLKANYALRIRFFGRDRALGETVNLKHEIIMLAKVSVDPKGRVAMQTQRCRDHGGLDGFAVKDDFQWLYPERLPPENFELVLRDGKVQTEAAPRPIGYDPAPPSTCKPGDRVDGRPEQAWLTGGKCTCSADPLPMLSSDCRVTDPDADKLAGISVRHSITDKVDSARVLDSSQVVEGVLSADGRIRGKFIENYDFLGLSCGSSTCLHNDIVVCPLELNPVQFEPLSDSDAALDCASILTQVDQGKFFTTEMWTFPGGC